MVQNVAAKLATILSFGRFCRGQGYPESPLELTLEISNLCDLKCAMCAEFSHLSSYRSKALKQQQRGFLYESDLKKGLHSTFEKALLINCFGYGEPTIHPDFNELVTFVSQYRALISFTTQRDAH